MLGALNSIGDSKKVGEKKVNSPPRNQRLVQLHSAHNQQES